MSDTKPNADYLFETSFEVCNKVGGIYTVVKSKAALMKDMYPNYFLVGPYFQDKAAIEMEPEKPSGDLQSIFEELKRDGIICYYGKWLIKGEPKVILLEFSGMGRDKDRWKSFFWDHFRIDSLGSGWDFEEPMLFSVAAAKLIEKFSRMYHDKKVVAHFHEWMCGFGGLYLKQNLARVGTVFTTHATMLGRSLSGSGHDLYSNLSNLDPETEAYKMGVQNKWSTEKACAQNFDIFTTVSEITAIEAEKILSKKADVILPNGLDIGKFPTEEETSAKHVEMRGVIRDFFAYYFSPHYSFDLKKTRIFFVVGRYEYKNKGLDILTRALAKLNDKLKGVNADITVVTLFFIPDGVNGIKREILENKTFYAHIKDFVDNNLPEIKEGIVSNVVRKKELSRDLFSKEFLQETKKQLIRFSRVGNPLLVTHNLNDESNDPILRGFLENGLTNKEEDKVKVIKYPVYLTGTDGLLDISYYDTIMGCHLGIFPSYYEPWGYTPLETAALGVAAVTTDLAGYGRFMNHNGHGDKGVFVLKRYGRSDDDAVNDLTELMFKYCSMDRAERVDNKLYAKKLSELADWKELIGNYVLAHNMALNKVER